MPDSHEVISFILPKTQLPNLSEFVVQTNRMLLLYNKVPQTKCLKTLIYYSTALWSEVQHSRAGYPAQNPTRLKSRCWLCFFLEALWKNLLPSLCPLLAEFSSL